MSTRELLDQDKASYARVQPPCPYFGQCGGCALQDLSYPDQIALKRSRLTTALRSVNRASASIDVAGCEEPWRYRNKVEFTFGESEGRLILGYHAARSFWRVVDLTDCLLLPEPAMRVARDVLRLAIEIGLPAYHARTHQGVFRYLIVRTSHATGAVMICIITTLEAGADALHPHMAQMAETLRAQHPQLCSVYWGVTSRMADVAQPETLRLLCGSLLLDDQMGPFRLQLYPLSFLQQASLQADRMYRAVCDALDGVPHRVAWDLYCGIGVMALYLSQRFETVYGIDIEPHHLELARSNAALNGVGNIEFRLGAVEQLLLDRRVWLAEAKPDVIVVDPPRAGLHPSALSSLLAARPLRIAYLSCNVQSLVRDLAILQNSFPRYRLAQFQAFDLFPQTNHVETLALLERDVNPHTTD